MQPMSKLCKRDEEQELVRLDQAGAEHEAPLGPRSSTDSEATMGRWARFRAISEKSARPSCTKKHKGETPKPICSHIPPVGM